MARSAKERVDAIRAKQERARREMEKAEEEFERLIQPTKKKIVAVVEEVADQMLRENIDEIDRVGFRREAFRKEIERLLREQVFEGGGGAQAAPRAVRADGREGGPGTAASSAEGAASDGAGLDG